MQAKELTAMREIRNDKKKLVCFLDERQRIVEIVHKGCTTTIHFISDGTVKIVGGK